MPFPGVIWMVLLTTACAVALLMAFQQVVDAGVQQADIRHRATLAHADAIQRCNHTAGLAQRELCQRQLQTARRAETMPKTSGAADAVSAVPADR
jgi:hypothetical protein